ncbi:MAG: hypothetical protein V1837_06565 [Candidatus Woesearchaeota archaeon]
MRSQVSMQFLVMVGIVFVFFVVFVAGFAERYNDILTEKERAACRDLVFMVHDEIAIAHKLEDGYSRNFTIPDKLEGVDYSITLNNNIVAVTSPKAEYSTMVPSVVGSLHKGQNMILKRNGIVCLGAC